MLERYNCAESYCSIFLVPTVVPLRATSRQSLTVLHILSPSNSTGVSANQLSSLISGLIVHHPFQRVALFCFHTTIRKEGSIIAVTMIVFIVYEDENLNEEDDPLSGISFAVKNNDYYTIYTTSSCVQTLSDPRDTLKTGAGNFRMFILIDLTNMSSDRLVLESIFTKYQSQPWPRNVLNEMISHGFLDKAHIKGAIENRRSSANVPYNRSHSQTNGA